MTRRYELRRAELADAAEIEAVVRKSARTAYKDIFPPEAPLPDVATSISHWQDRLARQGRGEIERTFVAAGAGQICGVVTAARDANDQESGHIAQLYVDPEHWGRGVGTALYGTAVNHLADNGFTRATLWTLADNRKARDWYERHGWRPTGERFAVYEPGGIYDLVYELTLSGDP